MLVIKLGKSYGVRSKETGFPLRGVWPRPHSRPAQTHQHKIGIRIKRNLPVSGAEDEKSGAIRRCHVTIAENTTSCVSTIHVKDSSRELPDRDGVHFIAANYRYLKSRTILILRRLTIKNINRDKKIDCK